jgi:RHS repeat-associated protein
MNFPRLTLSLLAIGLLCAVVLTPNSFRSQASSVQKKQSSMSFLEKGLATPALPGLRNSHVSPSELSNLNETNDPPTAVDDSYTLHPVGSDFLLSVLANDSDPEGGPLFLSAVVTNPQHGTAQIAISSVQYRPTAGYTGGDSFSYRVCDAQNVCANGNVSISVQNQTPTAVADDFVIRGLSHVNFVANDSDADGDNFGIEGYLSYPQHGILAQTGNPKIFQFLPQPLYFTGTDSFTYRICDGGGACSTATVTFYIIGDGDGEDNGECPCSAGIGRPINVTNGNMYLQQSDYSLPSAGPALDVTRTYNSNSSRIGLFGRGWSSAYDESLEAYDSNLVRFNQSDGRAIYFGRAAGSSGALEPIEKDFHGSLTQNGGSGFTLTMTYGSVRQFNSAGKLVSLGDRVGNQTTLEYDGAGKLATVTDPFDRVLSFNKNTNGQVLWFDDNLGTAATYTYGGSNQLLSVTYDDNSSFTFGYDGSLRLTSVTDALGNVVESHTYDSQGRAITSARDGGVELYTLSFVSATETDVTDALGRVTKYTFDTSKGRNVVTQVQGMCNCGSGSQVQTWTYDNKLNLTAKADALNHVTTYTYDANGNRLTETNPTGTVTYTYNQFAEVLTRTDQLSGVTTNTFDSLGDLLTTEDALGHTTTFTYHAQGQLASVTDARGNMTAYTHDSSGRLTRITDALSHGVYFEYDERAHLTNATNALDEVTSYEYDAAGRLKKVIYPDTNFVLFTYDLAGRRTKVKAPQGDETSFSYDAAYRLTGVTDALNHATTFGYDLMSNRTSMTDALSRTTDYIYDDFNRLIQTSYPPATTGANRLFEVLAYDAVGNVTERTDTAGRVTNFGYDDINRPTTTTDASDQTTSFGYDALSRTTSMTDALSQEYQFDYDAMGRQTQMTRGSVSMSYTYDEVGNRSSRTDYNGATTNYTYDELNRLTNVDYPDSTGGTYAYDNLSRLTTATNQNGVVTFTYDNRGRVSSTTDVWGQTLGYSYDPNGNRTALSLNASNYATYTYDPINRLSQLTDSNAQAVTYGYDVTNKLTSRTLPNGVNTTETYDGLDRLKHLKDAKGATAILDNQYSYNTASQILENIDLGGAHNYSYDPLDRVTWAAYPGTDNEEYTYDSVGNRTSAGGPLGAYSYEPYNRLSIRPHVSYSYDNNGNELETAALNRNATYVYDFENRLTAVTKGWRVQLSPRMFTWYFKTISYQYDALGRRISRNTSSDELEKFVYDGQDVIADLDGSDQVVRTYLNGPGIDNKIRQTDANGNLYYTSDHLGSTAALTNDSGNVVEQITYDAFGNSSGSAYTRYTYTGREFDTDTGLYYYRARFYDPAVGRFISEDPIGFAGGNVNIYSYVGNNPILFSDPSGLWDPKAHAEIIKQALERCLSDKQRRQLQDASEWVDRAAGQLEANAYQHGMRGGPGQSVEDARKAAGDFISGHLKKARSLAPQGCQGGYGKIPWDALWEFGQGLHTITDMTSPAHEGFQIWYGPPYPTGIPALDPYLAAKYAGYIKWHHDQETREKLLGNPARFRMIKDQVRKAFADTFGDCGCCGD